MLTCNTGRVNFIQLVEGEDTVDGTGSNAQSESLNSPSLCINLKKTLGIVHIDQCGSFLSDYPLKFAGNIVQTRPIRNGLTYRNFPQGKRFRDCGLFVKFDGVFVSEILCDQYNPSGAHISTP